MFDYDNLFIMVKVIEVMVLKYDQHLRPMIEFVLTNIKRHVFSLSAPTHPEKPIMNIMAPTIINMSPGSTKNSVCVRVPMFWNICFSYQA